MADKVVMRHPKLGDDELITVSKRAQPIHEKAGWKVAPKTKQPEKG